MLSIHKKRPVRKGVHQLSVLKPNAKVVKINDIDRADTLYISLQASPSVPCASSSLQSLDNLACKIV